eukprot:6345746-Prymnesium_polylepis.1
MSIDVICSRRRSVSTCCCSFGVGLPKRRAISRLIMTCAESRVSFGSALCCRYAASHPELRDLRRATPATSYMLRG